MPERYDCCTHGWFESQSPPPPPHDTVLVLGVQNSAEFSRVQYPPAGAVLKEMQFFLNRHRRRLALKQRQLVANGRRTADDRQQLLIG